MSAAPELLARGVQDTMQQCQLRQADGIAGVKPRGMHWRLHSCHTAVAVTYRHGT